MSTKRKRPDQHQQHALDVAKVDLLMGKRLELHGPGTLVIYMGSTNVDRPDPFWYEHPGGRIYKRSPEEVIEAVLPHVGYAAFEKAKRYDRDPAKKRRVSRRDPNGYAAGTGGTRTTFDWESHKPAAIFRSKRFCLEVFKQPYISELRVVLFLDSVSVSSNYVFDPHPSIPDRPRDAARSALLDYLQWHPEDEDKAEWEYSRQSGEGGSLILHRSKARCAADLIKKLKKRKSSAKRVQPREPLTAKRATIYYRAPYSVYLYKYEVAPEHMDVFLDRLSRGVVSPRHHFEARPNDWTYVPREKEPKEAPGNVHEWDIQWHG